MRYKHGGHFLGSLNVLHIYCNTSSISSYEHCIGHDGPGYDAVTNNPKVTVT